MVVSPGRTEAIEKYLETAADLRGRGFAVLIHDWRGQGLSQRPLANPLAGHARGAGELLADYRALLAAFETRLPRPWLTLGHSMGGCLALLALARAERRFCCAILSAPMLGIPTGRIPYTVGRSLAFLLSRTGAAGRYAQAPWPPTPFEANVLTHDPIRYARNEALVRDHPELALGPPTWGWVDFAFAAGAELQAGPGARKIEIPVTIVAAGEERVVDNRASRRVAARLPHGRYVEVAGAYHELLQETDDVRAAFWREFDDLAARLLS